MWAVLSFTLMLSILPFGCVQKDASLPMNLRANRVAHHHASLDRPCLHSRHFSMLCQITPVLSGRAARLRGGNERQEGELDSQMTSLVEQDQDGREGRREDPQGPGASDNRISTNQSQFSGRAFQSARLETRTVMESRSGVSVRGRSIPGERSNSSKRARVEAVLPTQVGLLVW